MSTLKVNNRDKFNSAMKGMANFYSEKFDRLLLYVLRNGTTLQEIAEAVGVTKQSLSDRIDKMPEGIKNDF